MVTTLGIKRITHIYTYADVLHCEPIEKVADDIITEYQFVKGRFDNVKDCLYTVPDTWTIGKVYARLIEDVSDEHNIIEKFYEVYTSWIDDALSNYHAATYYQQREYIAESFLERSPIDI